MTDEPLPLLDLFLRLREAGLELGITEYQLLIKALQRGLGTSGPDALLRLCILLWAKSPDEQQLVRRIAAPYAARLVSSPHADPVPQSGTWTVPDIPPVAESALLRTSMGDMPFLSEASPVLLPDTEQVSPLTSLQQQAISPPAVYRGERAASVDYITYLPLTRRQMQQRWRHLRFMVEDGEQTELDIERTIDEVARTSMFLEVALRRRRINRVELLLIIDRNGSMVPFHTLVDYLAATAVRGGKLGKTNMFYMHNAPRAYLYYDKGLGEGQKLQAVLRRLRPNRTAVLIISDAGAARGKYDDQRVERTRAFLKTVREHLLAITWLNPVPQIRWAGTSAATIAKHVAMFDLSARGFEMAIDALKRQHSQVARWR